MDAMQHDHGPTDMHMDHDGMSHGGHDHSAHSPMMFRRKFWWSLLLMVPTLLFSHTIQGWLGFQLVFTGSTFVPMIFGVIVFCYGGTVFLSGARDEIQRRQPGMMTLISMAIVVALAYSSMVTLGLVEGMDFWWELATLITIMLLGHWMEMASIASTSGALGELARLLPDEAEVIVGDDHRNVAVKTLKVGDMVLVRPGARIPSDGIVTKGTSKVNESMLTGESDAIGKTDGSTVIGGTVNLSGALNVRVTKVGDDTALAGIVKLVAEAQSSKLRTQVLADKAAFYLTFIAIAVALSTGAGWLLAGATLAFILERVVTVLVIACPHALGVAIPLVTTISTSMAAKQGLLVRQRSALEMARGVDVVLFDKTGTLTEGEQGVVDVYGDDTSQVISVATALEAESEHPIARAIVRFAQDRAITPMTISDFSNVVGMGVTARQGDREFHVGGMNLLKELHVEPSGELQRYSTQATHDGKTVVYVVRETTVIGAITLADVIRQESREAVDELLAMGKRVAIVTGDSQGVAAWVAGELGVSEYFAEVLPKHKVDIVKSLQTSGAKVAMVGDGVNDAPALVQADVGVAIGAGTDVAVESADVVLISSDPRGVGKMIKLSQATYRKLQENLAWATGYNVVAIPLATGMFSGLGVVLSPAVGAILMSLSTVIVVINAQFLRRLKL